MSQHNLPIPQSQDLQAAAGPIWNVELEKAILSSLITYYPAISETEDLLDAECFYLPEHQDIFRALMSVYRNGDKPDVNLVASELAKQGSTIGFLEIANLCVNSDAIFDIRQHAILLKDYCLRRRLWNLGKELLLSSGNEAIAIDSLQLKAKSTVDGLFENTETSLSTLGSVYDELMTAVSRRMSMPEGVIYGTPTGFPMIDDYGGLCGSNLIIIGAETSQGKTSFATALAMSAIEHCHGVAIYSMEMSAMQMAARIASMRSGVAAQNILYNKLSYSDLEKIECGMRGIDMGLMYFDEKSNSSLDSVLLSIRSMKMKHDIKGAVVDYLQLIDTKDLKVSREQAVAKCARQLKILATELDIWIIALSQLSRNPQNPVPNKARLRDSGQIEEAADQIFLIYRPSVTGKSYPEPFTDVPTVGTALVMLEKSRNSGLGQFICGFKAENTLFYPMTDFQMHELRNQSKPSTDPFSNIREDFAF